MATKGRQRTLYLITAAAMVAMIGGYAMAATSITTLSPQQNSNVTQSPTPGGFGSVATVSSEQLVVLTSGMTGVATAGTESAGAIGLSGTPATLPKCTVAPCPVSNFITALPATEVTGNWGEQLVLTVTQPAGASTNSVGFDIAITVTITVGVVTSDVNGLAYFATNANGVGTATSIATFIFVDLGTTTAPTIDSVSMVFNQCATATSCP